ncbi:Macrolide export ATP-binding/permease protein MacB [uncultured Bacteroides sp.]|uniref:ABC transporter permease n=1 Tax=Bacteroides cellulolyticus TaxID=2981780 RepID=UPI00082223D2|nr:ABC transporter permease [Bacteroides cellulolyticus]MCU6772980.1 ABC transporter permease [Bacteroides cellulolyticus]SCI70217.1 Macrolide export ATP-binding/permease protein MacB [uncultured Bacteroides sp.]
MLLVKIKYAIRFLLRARSYTVINLIGLSLSLACCIVLLRYIHRELTVDTHAIDLSSIIVPLRDIDGNIYPAENPNNKDYSVEEKYIEDRCKLIEEENSTIVSDDVSYKTNLMAADTTFFHFFDYCVMEGSLSLEQPNNALLTETYAKKLFGNESSVGRNIYYDGKLLTVTGVIEKPVCKTTFNFDVIVPHKLRSYWGKLNIELIRVNSAFDIQKQNDGSNIYRLQNENNLSGNIQMRYKYISWEDFYFESSICDKYKKMFRFGNRNYVFVLSGVVVLLFLVGVLNFVNLYSVVMQKRRKVYGVKKVFGLSGKGLFTEMWMENFLLFACAVFLSWCIIETTHGLWQGLFSDEIPITGFDWYLSLGLLLLVPLFTSVFFYFRYEYRRPVSCMHLDVKDNGKMSSRYVFLFLQYSVTLFLMILSVYFQRHFDFLINSSHGYETEDILVAQLYNHNRIIDYRSTTAKQLKERFERINNVGKKLDECPMIERWMNSSTAVWDGSPTPIVNDKDEKFELQIKFVSIEFFDFWGLEIVDGGLPDRIDYGGENVIVLNRSAMKLLGYTDLKEALVRSTSPLSISFVDNKLIEFGVDMTPVSAVVEDYYMGHLTEGIKPMIFIVGAKDAEGDVMIKVKKDREKEVIDYLRKVEKEIYNSEDFTYKWADDIVAEMYQKDKETAHIYTVFSYIAIVISCLGLLGISLFDIRRRYREIAIRKVNGAKPKDLYIILGKNYMLNLVLAFVVAAPVSWIVIYYYTASFVEKAPVTFGLFVIPLLIVLILSMLTLYYQINKAAHINPAEVMKSE